MFAIIRTGGKQYKVSKDQTITVEKIEAEAGKKVELEDVLLITDGKKTTVGSPLVKGAKVTAEVVEQTRGDKVIVFKKQKRQNHRRKKGHRQQLTVLKITDIKAA